MQGLVVMSGELEAAYRSISMAKVPDLWARVSYPSLKPLPSYLEDLYARLAMLQVACCANPPFCLPFMELPQAYTPDCIKLAEAYTPDCIKMAECITPVDRWQRAQVAGHAGGSTTSSN